MKNTGVIRKIDELGRIVIPKEIRKNLNIRNGEDVQIYVEEDKIILKKYQKILSIKEHTQKYLSDFSKFLINEVLVTDLDKVIASSSKNYINEVIDKKIIALINDRRQENGYTINIGNNLVEKNYYVYPLIIDADAIGSIIMISDKEISDKDRQIIEIVNSLLTNELY